MNGLRVALAFTSAMLAAQAHGQTPGGVEASANGAAPASVGEAPGSPPVTASPRAPCCFLPAGTPVEIELTSLVTSRRATSGDKFPIRLAQDLQVGGVVLAPAGAPGVGEVVDAAPGGLAGRPGKLILAARSLDLGTVRLPLRSFKLAGTGRDDSKTVMALTMTPYAGILAIGIHGGNIDYPAGVHAIAKVAADTFIPAPIPLPTPTPKENTP